MFKGCISLSDTSYLKGILNPTNSQGFKVENAEAMFEECNSLMQVDIQWQNIFSTVNNIKGMF
ncbi:MAG: hypothetical protein IKY94_15020 [Lachnospiraceae bacterium]|jgi:hypothetical protein|nr:hypothetical protein [Lachnospiraceae bacterium]